VTRIIIKYRLAEPLDEFRPLRSGTDETEITFENIPELREFIDIPTPHERAIFKVRSSKRVAQRGPEALSASSFMLRIFKI
jgi:hypothetical protein